MNDKIALILIVGPTAVGKTDLSLRLAEKYDGEIVSVDSRLFYRGMDIGTAKPSKEEQARVPHHLVDVTDPDQTWSLSIFQEEAKKAIEDIASRGKLPILVGGTGQFVRAVIEGWLPPEQPPAPELRTALENWTNEIGALPLYLRLAVLDPEAAAVIEYQNVRRTIRALEVIFSTGQKFSEQRRKSESPYNALQIGLTRPRPELYARVDQRIADMLAAGLVDEVRGLLDQGYPPDLPAFSAIGYKQIIDHLQGEISLNEAVILIKRLTRIFVRRQTNWFRLTDPQIHWFAPNEQSYLDIIHLIDTWRSINGGK